MSWAFKAMLQTIDALDATFLSWTTTVVRNRRHVFDQLHVQSCSLKCRDCTLATAAWSFHPNLDITHAKLACLFGSLLGSTLACEWCAFATAFETASPRASPTKSVAFWVRDGYCRIVEGRMDVCDTIAHIATNTFLFVCLCHKRSQDGLECWCAKLGSA